MKVHNDSLVIVVDVNVRRSQVILFDDDSHPDVYIHVAIVEDTAIAQHDVGTGIVQMPGA